MPPAPSIRWGEWGVGLFTLAETVFPPIPSEVILPLAGFLARLGINEPRPGPCHQHFGRLLPGVRSLISLPAGAQRMNLGTFSLFTVAGSGLWNGLLIGLGALLGPQYRLIDEYARFSMSTRAS